MQAVYIFACVVLFVALAKADSQKGRFTIHLTGPVKIVIGTPQEGHGAALQCSGGSLSPVKQDEISILHNRTLARFTKGSKENNICWNRSGVDGFISVVDAHNHFRPFGGPAVPFRDYIGWMIDSGIVFSTVFGIGQLIKKKNPKDPECCYYLDCANLNYPVIPDLYNDILNAEDYRDMYMKDEEMQSKVHLTVSASSLNLQNPQDNMKIFNNLTSSFPNVFSWAGEINVIKHALAANGFFQGPQVSWEQIKSGYHDPLFLNMHINQWPVTLHCDIGCDQYDNVPLSADNPLTGCEVPLSEITMAKKYFRWWKTFLGRYYLSFFDRNNNPRENFKKIQHLHVWDTILSRFPDVKIIWAQLGLSKELKGLHPVIHKYILEKLFDKHHNLYADISGDFLAKHLFMNYRNESVDMLLLDNHEDMKHLEIPGPFSKNDAREYDQIRNFLHDTFLKYKDQLHATGSKDFLTGPTHALAIYLEVFNDYPDRFLTGIDFVPSMGEPLEYPGLQTAEPTGCMKDRANHARQLTDTSSINIFLDDEPFRKIVLGENFFKLTGLDSQYTTPPLC